MKRFFLATNDVELTSIRFNKQRLKSGESVLMEGMPKLLELYGRHKVKATFFVTGDIAVAFPDVVRQVVDNGHELACHSYSHMDGFALDKLDYPKQSQQLYKAKSVLEDISGTEVISFRAPALRVNEFTPHALHDAGFKIDSSIASQRADMFFSFGSMKKVNRLWAPRMPYYVSADNLARRGNYPIFEIPISAFLIPYIGTTMRISPFTIKLLRNLLHLETSLTGKPINFLIHPNECFVENDSDSTPRRSKGLLSYLFAEKLRRFLKLRNLSDRAIILYEQQLRYYQAHGYEFITCKDYYNNHRIHQINVQVL